MLHPYRVMTLQAHHPKLIHSVQRPRHFERSDPDFLHVIYAPAEPLTIFLEPEVSFGIFWDIWV